MISNQQIPAVRPEKKLTKISHGRSRSSLSDIDCTFVNRPTSVELNVAALSDQQLKETVLQLEHEWVFWYDDRKVSKDLVIAFIKFLGITKRNDYGRLRKFNSEFREIWNHSSN